ncbi:MAG: hypothetical protein H6615_09275 [Ignavibacteria bacterium]|nr:hypothetical protein [Ignavibacteria bacterium]
MRKILLLIAFLSFVLVGCGEPESYGMTSDEFKNKYEKQVKELMRNQIRDAFKNALDGDKTKEEIQEETRENMSAEIESLTGLTMDEFDLLEENSKLIKSKDSELLKTMTIKEILDYQQN